MWEERSCSQVRQWQHWGSGCYNYVCQSGRLHIKVLNHTFTCYYPRQEINISLMDNGWLHTGSLVCPACEEVCEVAGAKTDMSGGGGGNRLLRRLDIVGDSDGSSPSGGGGAKFKCRPGILPPKNFVYYQDILTCGGASCTVSWSVTWLSLLLFWSSSYLLSFVSV